MNIEVFAACDFAQDNSGKLTIVGIFDTIGARTTPLVHPFMCIAVRIRFMMHELGKHLVRLEMKDPDGTTLLHPFEKRIDLSNIGNDSSTANVILNQIGLRLQSFGKYEIQLFIDNEYKTSLSLYVARVN